MNRFLVIALRNAARGFRVHPLRGKDAFLKDWPNVATTDTETIQTWAAKFPDYNCGVAAGPDIAILDSDRVSRLKELAGPHAAEWFNTFSVTSGRPDRAHFYYRMTDEVRDYGNKKWAEPGIEGNVFEIKVHGGQVVAEGSVHPDTGQEYRITQDVPLIPFPAGLMQLIRECRNKDDGPRERVPREKIGEGGRHDALVTEAGRVLRVTEMSKPVLTAHLQDFNEQWIEPPLDSDEVERIAQSCNWQPEPTAPQVTIGGNKPVTDWREHYHTLDEMESAPPAEFLIDGFLQMDAITALAAPVAQRKSLIALNVAWSLCTGEPLFDHFTVSKQPTRVLYLCPEMGIRSFTARLRSIGLMPFVGKTLFCRTMSATGALELAELMPDELNGAAVIIDTAVRYLKGDENSSEDMRAFAEAVFRLMRDGAVSVLLLHHSAKGTKESSELSLENAMRGSGELGAFLSSCWATRLQQPDEPYQSASYLTNVKQRDFESKPFEVTSGPDCRLHIADTPGDHVTLNSKAPGLKADKDGKEAAALQMIRDNPNLSDLKMSRLLKDNGIQRGPAWVGNKRREFGLRRGITVGSESPTIP